MSSLGDMDPGLATSSPARCSADPGSQLPGHGLAAAPAGTALARVSTVPIGVPLQTPAPLLTNRRQSEGATSGARRSFPPGRRRRRHATAPDDCALGRQEELKMRPRLRRAALTDRLLARALALGATSEHPTALAVNDLWRLAGGDHEELERALARIDHPSGSVGHPRTVARALL